MNKEKTILITGANGFIGSNLKEYFKDEYNLLTPRSFELDCTNSQQMKNYFKQNNIDFVIHCATIGGIRAVQDEPKTLTSNIKMVDNILEYKKENARVILFGSGAMYDKSRSLKKVKEEEIGLVEPLDLYGKSKLLIAKKIKDRKDCVCLNIFGCYGKNEKNTRFPTYAITQNLKKEDIIINQNVVFDYLYIDDLTKIIDYFLENQPINNILNTTPKESISLVEIANIINEISNYKSKIIIKCQNLGNEYTGNNSLLLQELQNIKFTSFEEGLKAFYSFLNQK